MRRMKRGRLVLAQSPPLRRDGWRKRDGERLSRKKDGERDIRGEKEMERDKGENRCKKREKKRKKERCRETPVSTTQP